MKYFLLLSLISFSAWARERVKKETPPELEVKEIVNLEFKNGSAIISLRNVPMSIKIPENDKVMPCLRNAWQAQQKVLLMMDENEETIMDCKLYAGGILDMGTPQGTPKVKKEAQEDR